jgi:hypothetical protein
MRDGTEMKYYDYDWDIKPNCIVLDSELNTDRLGWRAGDLFEFVNVDGRQMLKKVDPLVKFLRDGERNGHSRINQ